MKLITTILALLFSFKAFALNELILDPSPQSTSNTCQSYSIAFALAQSGLWHEPIETPKQLRKLEVDVRSTINKYVEEEKAKGHKVSPYHHSTWAEAVKRVSSNNLELKLFYPSTPREYYEKVIEVTGNPKTGILSGPIAASLVTSPIMTSVTRLENSKYKSGHIVTLIGLVSDLPQYSSIATMDIGMLVLNSAVKSGGKTFNMCSEDFTPGDKKYSAELSLTKSYDIKQWGGKYLLMWIQKKS